MWIHGVGLFAHRLTRNPIGIVGLFLLMIYGIAALVLGTSAGSIDTVQSWILVGFLVLFPHAVLLVFYRLVSKYHANLYAPGDFRDESLFVQSLSLEERRRRLKSKVAEAEDGLLATGRRSGSEPELSPSEQALLNARQSEHVRHEAAAEWSLRELETELGVRFRRHVLLGAPRGDLAFDGVADRDGEVLAVEVKYLRSVHQRMPAIDATLKRLFDAAQYFHGVHTAARVRLFLVMVVNRMDDGEREAFEERMTAATQFTGLDLRLYTFDDLEQRHGLRMAR